MSLSKVGVVIETFSGAEWQAHTGLLHRGVASYFPYVLADRRHGRWTQASIKPQFPGYIFASIDAGWSINPILKTTGVRDVLRNGVNVVLMPIAQLARIRAQCRYRYREAVPKLVDMRLWKVGDVVAVPHGAFAGTPVEIASIDKSGNVSAYIGSLVIAWRLDEGAVQQTVPSMAARGENATEEPSDLKKAS